MFRRIPEAIKYILRDPKDWILVHKEESKWDCINGFGDKDPFVIWYLLYETSSGVRRYKINYTGSFGRQKTAHKRDDFFLNSVKPWLSGVRVKGIDSYAVACQQMTMDELAGK